MSPKRFTRGRRLAGEGAWVVAGQLAAVVGALFSVRALSGVLTPAEYGRFALGMTVAILLGQTVFGPLGNGAARFFAPARESGELLPFAIALRTLIFRLTFALALGSLVVSGMLIAGGLSGWVPLFLASWLFGMVSGLDSVLSSIQNAARRRGVVAFHQGLAPWIRALAALVVATWILSSTAGAAMLGFLAASGVFLLSQISWARQLLPIAGAQGRESDPHWYRTTLTFAVPIASWGLFTWAQLASARWALAWFGSLESLGLYSVLFQIGYYPVSLAVSLGLRMTIPVFFARAGDGSDSARQSSAVRLGLLAAGAALVVVAALAALSSVMHGWVFALVVDPDYAGVSSYLPWIIVAGGLFAVGEILAVNKMTTLQTATLILPKVATAIAGVALNIVGAYLFELPGVVAASVLYSMLYLGWMVSISRAEIGAAAREWREHRLA